MHSSTEKLKTEARGRGGDVMHVNDPGSKLVGLGGRTGGGEAKTGGCCSTVSLMIDVWCKWCQGDGGALQTSGAGSDAPKPSSLLPSFSADRGTQLS